MLWLAKRHWRAGDAARDRGDWPAAADEYRKALRLHDRRSGVWLQYGHVLRESGDMPGAVDAYAKAVSLAPGSYDARRAIARYGPRTGRIDRFGFVMLGTTGLCNASCIHCPTNKVSTEHLPRIPMAMPLFRRIIDEIADSGITIFGHVSFGLFGDGLIDPDVIARARYLRERLPDVHLTIATNGAGFNPERHKSLIEFNPLIGLHCESLQPATFDTLMAPLRLERVIVKYEQILSTFPGMVRVAVPVSRRNRDEQAGIREWFEARGATVFFAPLMSRCADDRSVFDELAFAPSPVRCTSQVLEDLSIDSDGTVLACCQDFGHAAPLGKIGEESLMAILNGRVRAERAALLDQNRHAEIATCSRCLADPAPEALALA